MAGVESTDPSAARWRPGSCRSPLRGGWPHSTTAEAVGHRRTRGQLNVSLLKMALAAFCPRPESSFEEQQGSNELSKPVAAERISRASVSLSLEPFALRTDARTLVP